MTELRKIQFYALIPLPAAKICQERWHISCSDWERKI